MDFFDSPIKFDQEQMRKSALSVITNTTASTLDKAQALLAPKLTDSQLKTQEYIQQLAFEEGAWYRPFHNVLVPAAMLAVLKGEGGKADLMVAAQLHDIGYVGLEIASTLKGADWATLDKRQKHMKNGVEMAAKYLSDFIPNIASDRVPLILDMIGGHDNPYIDKPLPNEEAKLLWDADRLFVPSVVSWYKDLIAYCSDPKYQANAKSLQIEITPEIFLQSRVASFYPTAEDLPKDWDQKRVPHKPETLKIKSERNKPLPQFTETGQKLVDWFLTRRAEEFQQLGNTFTGNQLKTVVSEGIIAEMNHIIHNA